MEATARSRSRSRDRYSRGSDSDEEKRRRRKRSKDRKDKRDKKEKKEKKARKNHKRSRRDSSSEDEHSEISETSQSRSLASSAAEITEIAESKVPEPTSDRSATSTAPKMSKHQFFAQLLAKEGSKGSKTVGTVHALGKQDEQAAQQSASTGDWECYKCGTSNFRHNIQCHKCKAMKRLTEWR